MQKCLCTRQGLEATEPVATLSYFEVHIPPRRSLHLTTCLLNKYCAHWLSTGIVHGRCSTSEQQRRHGLRLDCAELDNVHETGAGLTLGSLGATVEKAMEAALPGVPLRWLQWPTLSVGRKLPGQPWPHPLKGWNLSFSNTSSSTGPAAMCKKQCFHYKHECHYPLQTSRFHKCMFMRQVWSVSSCWLLLSTTCSSNTVQLQVIDWSSCSSIKPEVLLSISLLSANYCYHMPSRPWQYR